MTTAFGSNITIDGGPRNTTYEAALLHRLTTINATRTGSALLTEIGLTARRALRIVPWTLAAQNADATPVSERDAYLALEPLRTTSGAPTGSGLGTGAGSDVVIRYTPSTFYTPDARLPGNDASVVLVHEMAHALRDMRGVRDRRGIRIARFSGMPTEFENVEELFAITVANIYASERHLPLRGGHTPGEPIQNERFWREPTIYNHLERCFASLLSLKVRLQAINVPFNPVQAMAGGVSAYMRLMNETGHIVDTYSRAGH